MAKYWYSVAFCNEFGVMIADSVITEPFIVPALYEKYANVGGQQAVDEYTLSQNMGSNLTAELTNHCEF